MSFIAGSTERVSFDHANIANNYGVKNGTSHFVNCVFIQCLINLVLIVKHCLDNVTVGIDPIILLNKGH